ncbi:MAG: hypothetical protein IPO19_04980 [Rhodoferax sp.]|nr:hypothetical protein [Rhodoferax sp.]MBK9235445.1 hypothetical protein [Rhodoferax sp.]
MAALVAAMVIAAADLMIWRAALGALMAMAASVVWAGFGLAGAAQGKGARVAQRLGVGIGTLVLSWTFGLMLDHLNENAARDLAAQALAYKAERGVYPPVEIANGWARPVLGYTQRYALAGKDRASVWFTRFNHRLQSIAVATGQLQEERDQ